jgi:hypothetical protein
MIDQSLPFLDGENASALTRAFLVDTLTAHWQRQGELEELRNIYGHRFLVTITFARALDSDGP